MNKNNISYENKEITIIEILSPRYGRFECIIDTEDYNKIKQLRWMICQRSGLYYVETHEPITRKNISIHSLIFGKIEKNMNIDHINGNTLDNRKSNLRIATLSQNIRNRKKNINSKSKYKGICFEKRDYLWRARITLGTGRKNLGYFKNEIDAARAYDEAALKYYGEFARTNAMMGLL